MAAKLRIFQQRYVKRHEIVAADKGPFARGPWGVRTPTFVNGTFRA